MIAKREKCMWRFSLKLFIVVITSFCLFPVSWRGFPMVNSKMILAAVGLLITVIHVMTQRKLSLGYTLSLLSLGALMVSLMTILSLAINHANDYTYATYILSMWVWFSAAYAVCSVIKIVHGSVTIPLVGRYLAIVCVLQCALALWIDNSPSFQDFVFAHFEFGQAFVEGVKRLYGIGAVLDVAGIRFSCVLILISCIIVSKEEMGQMALAGYWTAFIFIAVVGNMIARTTTVGVLIALIYFIYASGEWRTLSITSRNLRKYLVLGSILMIMIPVGVYFYNNDPAVRKQLRFGFEGFFNWVEKGKWETSSTEKLKTMYVYPDNSKTWIIGDGYISNPWDLDPYYIGDAPRSTFYMGTDVGYLRFIFYFGLMGLAAYISFYLLALYVGIYKFPEYKALFTLLFVCNMLVWFKVSTDIFVVLAFLLSADGKYRRDQEGYDRVNFPVRCLTLGGVDLK